MKVSPRYSGDAITTTVELEAKLGKTAYRVWTALLCIRDGEAEAHPSMRGLAKAAGVSLHQARRSLIRLRQAKLVEDYGFHWKMVPCSCPHGCWGHKVYVRTVSGTIWPDNAGADRVRVPRATSAWLKTAQSHGGVRAGAGRPVGAKDGAPRVRRNNQDALPISTQKEKYSERATLSPRISPFSRRVKEEEKAGVKEKLERFLAMVPTPSSGPLQPKAEREMVPCSGSEPSLDQILPSEDALEWSLPSQGAAPRQQYTAEDFRAATELANAIPVLRVPDPPAIAPKHGEAQRLTMLDAAYRAAHERCLRQDYYRAKRTRSAKDQADALQAAEALAEAKINPTAWARFSFHQWCEVMGKKSAPSTRWVWSVKRVKEHASWCHEATGSQATQAPVQLPSVKELIRKLGALRAALGYGRPTAEVVAEILPLGRRKVLLAKAADEIETARADMDRRIAAGEWVWA